MTVEERKTFIEPRPNMMREEKNMHLSYMLRVPPHANQNIFRIGRAQSGKVCLNHERSPLASRKR